MAITLQALQTDGTWAVRNAFVTENKEVAQGLVKAADLEAKARKLMAQWQATYPHGGQLRVHNSANDPKPVPAPIERSDETSAPAITPERIEAAVRDPNFSHARRGDGCWRDLVWIYHRDPQSPSGFTLAIGGDASIVDPIIRRVRATSSLSPSERSAA